MDSSGVQSNNQVECNQMIKSMEIQLFYTGLETSNISEEVRSTQVVNTPKTRFRPKQYRIIIKS
jgi:hypothetical protein